MIPGSANPLLLASAAGAPAPSYQIERSLRFNSSDSAYLARTPSVAGNRKTWTWAGWVKRSAFTPSAYQTLFSAGTGGLTEASIRFNLNDTLEFYDYGPSAYNSRLLTAQVFRDASAWLHVVAAFDSASATADQRLRLYINGLEVTTFSARTNPTQNYDGYVNNSVPHVIGDAVAGASPRFFSGYLADVFFIDSQALDPTSFGEFDASGTWQPKAYSGTYPGNSFHLPFSDNSTAAALGTDTSGAGNDWTVNNISAAAGAGNDSLVDTPTSYGTDDSLGGSVRGNYATLNPLDRGDVTLANGNLDSNRGTFSGSQQVRGTIGVSSGKWYWEVALSTEATFNDSCVIGIANSLAAMATNGSNNFWGYVYTGVKYSNASTSAYAAAFTTGDVIGIAFDADNGSLVFYKNGASQGTAFTGLASASYFPCSGMNGAKLLHNFGQRPFAYTAPSGYKALCTTNLPAPVVAQPSTVMDVKLYTGNGSTQTISGLGFSPDLVWIKGRSISAAHRLTDAIRGAGYSLYSNLTNAETLNDANGYISALGSDGFTVAAGSVDALGVNASGSTYVAWTWDAGSSTVTNTQGSITSTVRANPSAGFSIVAYTGNGSAGATVGHGLGVAPSFIITKNRNQGPLYWWTTYHISTGATSYLQLNDTAAAATNIGAWNNTTPGSSVFTLGNFDTLNRNGDSFVAYCFAPVTGLSSFGSYQGNGSADGPFVYTGFRPRWVMWKSSTSAGTSWVVIDVSRDIHNVSQNYLLANTSGAEAVAGLVDIVSNGFKIRATSTGTNVLGETIVYAAFAEHPFQAARAR